MFGFGKKKLYKIKYSHLSIYETIIAARSPSGALRKFYKMHTTMWDVHSIEEIGNDS